MKPAKELFKDSWLFFKSHWTTLIVISIGFGIASYIYNNLLPLLASGIFKSIIGLVHTAWLSTPIYIIAGIIVIAFIIGSILFSCAQNILPPFIIQELLEQRPLTFKDVAKRIIRMSPGYIWLSILMGLIVIGGLIAFIIPGVYFAIVFTFAMIAFIVDGKKGFAALAHSQALFKGRFWKVVGKAAYPILYPFALLVLLAIILAPLFILVESLWVIVPVLIVVGIPALIALFALYYMSLTYSIKLYRELTSTTSADVLVVPTWIKVWTWLGGAILIALLTIGISFAVKNPEAIRSFVQEMKMAQARKDQVNPFANRDKTKLSETQVYDNFGLNFTYPGRFVDTGPNEMNGSLTVLTDASSPSVELGYMPQIAVLGYQPKDEVKNLTALDLLKRNFVPDFESAKKAGEVIEYTVAEKVFNGYRFAVITSKELIEGQSAVTQTTLYKDQETIYLFQAIALEAEKDVLNQALDQILGTIQISEMVSAE